jgi:hypothetical protein
MTFFHRPGLTHERKPCPNMGNPCFCTGICLERVDAPAPMRTWIVPDDVDNEDYRGDR